MVADRRWRFAKPRSMGEAGPSSLAIGAAGTGAAAGACGGLRGARADGDALLADAAARKRAAPCDGPGPGVRKCCVPANSTIRLLESEQKTFPELSRHQLQAFCFKAAPGFPDSLAKSRTSLCRVDVGNRC